MTYEHILVEKRDAVGLITLNRPQALNALCAALVQELADALDAYFPFHAARADLLRRLDSADARPAYERALALAPTEADHRFITRRLEPYR